MNKAIFGVGCVLAAAAGSAITYFLTRNKYEQILEEYEEECRERIDALIEYYEGGADADESEEDDSEDEEDDPKEPEEFRNNEGVKKYHQYSSGTFGSDSVQSIFSKENVKEVAGAVRFKTEEEKVTEGQKEVLKRPKLEDAPNGVDEITSEEFDDLDDDKYTRVYLQYNINTDELVTNDGELAEEAYAKTRGELISNCWRWATDYWNEEEGEGDFYIKNDNLMIAFQVGLIFDPEAEMVEV